MTRTKPFTAAIAAVSFTAASVLAVPGMAQQAVPPVEIQESEIDAFVVAYKEVVAIEQDYSARIQQVEDEAEKQSLVQEAQTEMTEAVDESPDIEVDRYVEILQLAQTDPDLQAQLSSKLQD